MKKKEARRLTGPLNSGRPSSGTAFAACLALAKKTMAPSSAGPFRRGPGADNHTRDQPDLIRLQCASRGVRRFYAAAAVHNVPKRGTRRCPKGLRSGSHSGVHAARTGTPLAVRVAPMYHQPAVGGLPWKHICLSVLRVLRRARQRPTATRSDCPLPIRARPRST